MIECNKEACKQRYIGETKRYFRKRMAEHWGYIQNKNLENLELGLYPKQKFGTSHRRPL